MYPGTATNKKIKIKKTIVQPFKQSVDDQPLPGATVLVPAANITETSAEYFLQMATPGMEREDFCIEIESCVITIAAKKEKLSRTDSISDRCEYNYSEWARSFALPEDADAVLAYAKYKNGELTIRIPRGNTMENQNKATVYVY